MPLNNELNALFSPSVRCQALTIEPEAVDALAVQEAVGALLRLKGKGAEQVSYVGGMNPTTAVALCRWLSDPQFWAKVGRVVRQ